MEKAQTGTTHNSESSSISLCMNRTDVNELSKEKEEELLFGAEDEGDDEDVLSDDSLRLRLSDDEDAEQEDITSHANISESKLQSKKTEQQPVDVITEEELCPSLQQIVEEVKCDSGESLQKEHISVIKALDNSALLSDEYMSENKEIQDNKHNSKNSNVIFNESKDCTSKSNKDLKVIENSNACPIEISEQNIRVENNNLSANAKLTSEDNLKEITSNSKEINSTDTGELHKLDNIDSNSSIIDSTKDNIYINEKLSIVTTISDSNNDNLSDKVVDKTINDDHSVKDHSVKLSLVKIDTDQDFIDSMKSNSLNDLSSPKVSIEQEHKNKNPEREDIIQSKDVSKTQTKEKEMSTLLVKNDIDSPNIKGSTEVINEDRNINRNLIQDVNKSSAPTLQSLLLSTFDVEDYNHANEIKNADTIITRKKRSKNISTVQDAEEDRQDEKESGRQKRRTARNAEEIIRKKYLDSDSDSSDSTEQFVTVNHRLNHDIRPTSPPSLKRNYPDNEIFNGGVKKVKMGTKLEENNDVTKLTFIEKFFQRDAKDKLPKLTQEELEELLIQKVAETITMRSEIGQLREQARISEKYQEVTRTKLQQLMKQVKDFEMVLSRNAIDRRANPDKSVAPIKINRSVGLQVNFITEHGVQNLRQVQQTSNVKPENVPRSVSPPVAEANNATSPRRGGIKIRSPRPMVTTSASTVSQSSLTQTAPFISSVTPAALVVAKPLESSHALTLSNQPTPVQPILPIPQPQTITQIQQPQPQAIVLNGKIQNQINRPTLITAKSRNSDLIDLTDEEEKTKSTRMKGTTVTATSIIEQQLNVMSKSAQPFQRVIQTIPANVAITTQPNIKVIAPNQPAPALVNNINPPRLAYVMQSTAGSPRQVLITSNANQQVQIRPATTCNRPSFPVTYKTGISTIANGTVRVLTTPVVSNIQINKHPAPLPDVPNYTMTPGWKLPPPTPSLKISKVSNGIVLSWNMNLSDKYADIASYQLYAYQEVAGVNPSTSLWKKVGDVRALPLPMACTLTQFSEGNTYYFAVRAVDTHSRKGQYSAPGNISL